jgi:hypothetical protein
MARPCACVCTWSSKTRNKMDMQVHGMILENVGVDDRLCGSHSADCVGVIQRGMKSGDSGIWGMNPKSVGVDDRLSGSQSVQIVWESFRGMKSGDSGIRRMNESQQLHVCQKIGTGPRW